MDEAGSRGEKEYLTFLERDLLVVMCQSARECGGLSAGRWYLALDCQNCKKQNVTALTARQHVRYPIVLCCERCTSALTKLGTPIQCPNCGEVGDGGTMILAVAEQITEDDTWHWDEDNES